MQPLRAHQLAYGAQEYPVVNYSTTGIDIVPQSPQNHSPPNEPRSETQETQK
jgi:hypothetical protein